MNLSRANLMAYLPVVLFGLIATTGPARSADHGGESQQSLAISAPPASQWQFNFTPYGWLMGVDGDVTVRGHTTDVNASFIDIVEESDSLMALMGFFEARRGPFSLFADVVWADLTFSGDLQGQANPIANLNVLVNANVYLGYELTIIQPGFSYEIARWTGGGSSTALDLMGSARYWNQSVDVSLNVTGTVSLGTIGFQRSGSRAIGRSGDLEWVDPVVGGRLRHQTASGAELTLVGDVGGFGVGSDFSWQAVATYGFDTMLLGMPVHTVVGYRALGVDYSETGPFGPNGIDAVLHGPVVGASFRW
jgi:hypothetical protein